MVGYTVRKGSRFWTLLVSSGVLWGFTLTLGEGEDCDKCMFLLMACVMVPMPRLPLCLFWHYRYSPALPGSDCHPVQDGPPEGLPALRFSFLPSFSPHNELRYSLHPHWGQWRIIKNLSRGITRLDLQFRRIKPKEFMLNDSPLPSSGLSPLFSPTHPLPFRQTTCGTAPCFLCLASSSLPQAQRCSLILNTRHSFPLWSCPYLPKALGNPYRCLIHKPLYSYTKLKAPL